MVLSPSPLFNFKENYQGKILVLKTKKNSQKLRVEEVELKSGQICVKFEGIARIGDALGLVGMEVFAENGEDNAGNCLLDGFAVYSPAEEFIGQVCFLKKDSFNPLLIVKAADREIMIPFQKEIILVIDYRKQKIIADLPPGLCEL